MALIFLVIAAIGLFTGALPLIGIGIVGLLVCVVIGAKKVPEAHAAELDRRAEAEYEIWRKANVIYRPGEGPDERGKND